MTLPRAALYIGGASLLLAWFSSAASLSVYRGTNAVPTETEQAASGVEDLAAVVQHQSQRLRERLASTRPIEEPVRNPFAFRQPTPRPQPVVRHMVPAVVVATASETSPEPALRLVGMAEQRRPDGVARTAVIITADDDFTMATVGDVVLGRYRVAAVAADKVELLDVLTGATRVLTLEAP